MPQTIPLNLTIDAQTAVFTFSEVSDTSSVLEINFGVLGVNDTGLHGTVTQNNTVVWYTVPPIPLTSCDSITLNASSSTDIMENLSLTVIARTAGISNIPTPFFWISLTSVDTAGTMIENVQFTRARLYSTRGPINAQSFQGTSLRADSGSSPVFLRDGLLHALRVKAAGSDVTVQRISAERVIIDSTTGTMYLGLKILEPVLSADNCYIKLTSTEGPIVLTASIESNKSCDVSAVSESGDFTGVFVGFRGFYTVVMSLDQPDISSTVCTTNSTSHTKQCVGQVKGSLSSPGGVTHTLFLTILQGFVSLAFS